MQHDSESPPTPFASIYKKYFLQIESDDKFGANFQNLSQCIFDFDGLVLNLALLHSTFLLFCDHCHLWLPSLGFPHTHFHLDLFLPLHTPPLSKGHRQSSRTLSTSKEITRPLSARHQDDANICWLKLSHFPVAIYLSALNVDARYHIYRRIENLARSILYPVLVY